VAEGQRVRRVVRRVDPWTVLRFSLVFYLCMLVVWLVAGVLLWLAASLSGLIDNLERFVTDLFFLEYFQIRGGVVLLSAFVAGLVLVLLGTGINVIMAVVYNLTSDVTGGVEVTVVDKEQSPRRTVV
jgi:hypothetical protein